MSIYSINKKQPIDISNDPWEPYNDINIHNKRF